MTRQVLWHGSIRRDPRWYPAGAYILPGYWNLERSGFTGWPLDDDIVRSLGDINRNEHWLGVMIACVSHLHLLKNHRYGYQ
jgi:hypothetical protein